MTDVAKQGRDFIVHYGVKGMRWGVRNDRSPTEVGAEATRTILRGKAKVKTTGGENKPPSSDAVKAETQRRVLKKSGVKALSNQELQELANRLNLEVQVKRLDAETQSSGKKLVKGILRDNAQQTARSEAQSFVQRTVKEAKNRK